MIRLIGSYHTRRKCYDNIWFQERHKPDKYTVKQQQSYKLRFRTCNRLWQTACIIWRTQLWNTEFWRRLLLYSICWVGVFWKNLLGSVWGKQRTGDWWSEQCWEFASCWNSEEIDRGIRRSGRLSVWGILFGFRFKNHYGYQRWRALL